MLQRLPLETQGMSLFGYKRQQPQEQGRASKQRPNTQARAYLPGLPLLDTARSTTAPHTASTCRTIKLRGN